ncbi:unnamed protein product [Lota lota]
MQDDLKIEGFRMKLVKMESQLGDIQDKLDRRTISNVIWNDAYYLCRRCRFLPKSEIYGLPIGCCYPVPPQVNNVPWVEPDCQVYSNEPLEETKHRLKVGPQK